MSELVERWPGYDEQSWAERFAELNRRHDSLFRSFNALHEEAIKALAEKRDRIEALERDLGRVRAEERERAARIATVYSDETYSRDVALACRTIAAAIRNGEREQGWQDIATLKPQFGEVLGYAPYCGYEVVRCHSDGTKYAAGAFTADWVKFWLPLPEPPAIRSTGEGE